MLCNQRTIPFRTLLSATGLVTLVQRTRFELARARGCTGQSSAPSIPTSFQGWRVYQFRHLCVAARRSVTGSLSGKDRLPVTACLWPLRRPRLSHRCPRLSKPLPQNISIAIPRGTICMHRRHSFHALAEDAPGRCAGTATAFLFNNCIDDCRRTGDSAIVELVAPRGIVYLVVDSHHCIMRIFSYGNGPDT